jgi:hypothetical protein
LSDLTPRIHAIEEAYEFMLAYAAQGLAADAGSAAGGELRAMLGGAVQALIGLREAIAEAAPSGDRYTAFADLVAEDARRALVKFEIVLAQPGISSQMVDNLNASIHVRALLTDLFLLDEILKPVGTPQPPSI